MAETLELINICPKHLKFRPLSHTHIAVPKPRLILPGAMEYIFHLIIQTALQALCLVVLTTPRQVVLTTPHQVVL
jgi:hypothetical protein